MALILATLLELGAEDGVDRPGPGQAPTAFRIWRYGTTMTDKGASVFNEAAAERLLTRQEEHGAMYAIDVDHLSLLPEPPPESRKAVGWHRLGVRADSDGKPELWAVNVTWAPAIKAGLEANPPEWRYYSPAYDVDKETREVTRYLNTALTNTPATWQATALASAAAETQTQEDQQMTLAQIIAALKAAAEGDGDEAKEAAALLACYDKGTKASDAVADDSEEKKDEPETASDGEAEPEDKKEEDEPESASRVAASVGAPDVIQLAERLHALEIREAKARQEAARLDESRERERLLASRPDFSKSVRATLAGAPLVTVREACEKWERRIASAGTTSDAIAALGVTGTQGDTAGIQTGMASPPDVLARMDQQMGLVKCSRGVESTPLRLTLGVSRPATAAPAEGQKGAK